jgi:hypothetical protein
MGLYRSVRAPGDKLCLSCLPQGHHADTCADLTSGWDVVRRALVNPTDEYPVETVRTTRPVPVWTLVSIISGLTLIAIGWMLNGPVSRMVWEMIHG